MTKTTKVSTKKATTTKAPSADEALRTNRKRLTYLNQRISEAVVELAKLRDEQKTVKAKLISTK